jgi:hypothetical protein
MTRLFVSIVLGAATLISVVSPALADLFGSSWDEDIGKGAACFDAIGEQSESQLMARKLVIDNPTLDQLADTRPCGQT